MPLRTNSPIVRVEPGSMQAIDTTSAENLFGLWSIFSTCSGIMEDGKRLENLSWRLWNREVFCCAPDHRLSRPSRLWRRRSGSSQSVVLGLSSSAGSCSSREENTPPAAEGRSRAEKHITPIDLEKIVNSIKEKKELEPLSPLPPSLSLPRRRGQAVEPADEALPLPPVPQHEMVAESSASTVATAASSAESDLSPAAGSESSNTTDVSSSHSIVRGFSPGQVSSSYHRTRSQGAAAAAPAPKNAPPARTDETKRKAATFTLGASSDDGAESSLETNMYLSSRSSLSQGLRKAGLLRKTASFKDEIATRTIPASSRQYEHEDVFESDSEEEDEVSGSAIEEDDDGEWEDSDSDSAPASVDERALFQRVDSKPHLQLTSRPSLLTRLMHEGERAAALQSQAARSTPALRRSRAASPNGPSLAASPQQQQPDAPLEMRGAYASRSRPIIMTTSNTHQPVLSPRTTRRNMLSTELTESVRKNLLWERQQKNPNLRRSRTSVDVKNLKQYAGDGYTTHMVPLKEPPRGNNSWNAFFDHGLQEYHEKGW